MASTKTNLKHSEVTSAEFRIDNTSSDLEVFKQISILTDIFRTSLLINRCIGATPIQFLTMKPISKDKDLKYYKFIFCYTSWHFLYSFKTQIILTSAIAFVIFHVANGNVNVTRYVRSSSLNHVPTHNETETNFTFQNSIQITDILMFFIYGFAAFLALAYSTKDLAKLLNQWVKYLRKFALIFSVDKAFFPNFTKFHQSVIRIIRFCVAFTFLNIIVYGYMSSNCFLPNEVCTPLDLKISWVLTVLGSFVSFLLMMGLLMIVLLIKVVILAFCQLRNGIQSSQNKSSIRLKSIFSMIIFVRRQYKLVNRVCGPALLVFTGFLFSSSVVNWIIVLWLYKGSVPPSTAHSTLLFSFLQFVFFFMVTDLNIRVCQEEKEVLRVVLDIGRNQALSQLDQIEVLKVS